MLRILLDLFEWGRVKEPDRELAERLVDSFHRALSNIMTEMIVSSFMSTDLHMWEHEVAMIDIAYTNLDNDSYIQKLDHISMFQNYPYLVHVINDLKQCEDPKLVASLAHKHPKNERIQTLINHCDSIIRRVVEKYGYDTSISSATN